MTSRSSDGSNAPRLSNTIDIRPPNSFPLHVPSISSRHLIIISTTQSTVPIHYSHINVTNIHPSKPCFTILLIVFVNLLVSLRFLSLLFSLARSRAILIYFLVLLVLSEIHKFSFRSFSSTAEGGGTKKDEMRWNNLSFQPKGYCPWRTKSINRKHRIENYNHQKRTKKRVCESVVVGDDRMRVGVVQVTSNVCSVEFEGII